MDQKDLHQKGIEKAKKGYAFIENVLIIAMIVAGYFSMHSYRIAGVPIISFIYIAFAVLMLGFVLRKHLCTGCYYYGKCCHCAWGKLAAMKYKKESGNIKLGGKLAGLTWGVVMGLPVIVMVGTVILSDAVFTDILKYLILFLILVGINGVLHVKDCRQCKMRFICPASGAKKK